MDRLCPVAEDGKAAVTSLTLGEVLRAFLSSVACLLQLGARPLRVFHLLAACGTPALGANLYRCGACHKRHFGPRSCGDRHCPRCLAAKSRHWLQEQLASLLPIPYYHCVFTLPPELHALVLLNPSRLYPLLFECASQALLEFGYNRLGGDLGITAVLHTWGQQLNFHPHLHCIVTGGALGADGQSWRAPKQRKFLFPVHAVAALFRGKFLHRLKPMLEGPKPLRLPEASLKARENRRRWLSSLYVRRWILYAKRPFGGPEQVLSYLSNYTHRVALSNRRLLALDRPRQTVTFTYRDYRHGSKVKALTLSAVEFIGRFSWHILPAGLVRIRHYGILANNRRHRDIPRARAILQQRRHRRPKLTLHTRPGPVPSRRCPHCGCEALRWIGYLDARGRTHLSSSALIWDSS
jgi:Putative transposase/Transposase zinc-binding domain